jgi:hypothetical protein
MAMSFHLLVRSSVKSHASEITRRADLFDTCGIPTSLVQGKFADDLRPMQEEVDQQESSRRFSSKYSGRIPTQPVVASVT